MKMGSLYQYSQERYQNISIDIVGNFNTLAFSVLISSLVSLAKSNLYHTKKCLTLV